MLLDEKVLKQDERAIMQLRSLYRKYGYSQFKMSKFEEYDFYVRNKDFLVSDSIITFNDTSGKLLALKPDVTLSIIKNSADDPNSVQRVYYNESVYRIDKGSNSFREIMQTGLECIGDIDTYNLCEVILLAAQSLGAISADYILDISHMGFISAILDEISPDDSGRAPDAKERILKYISEKNLHDIDKVCCEYNIPHELYEKIAYLVQAYGNMAEVIEKLKPISQDEKMQKPLQELEAICAVLTDEGLADKVNVDFSIVNDMNYYSGILFKGYIEGIPQGVLSGGQYDKLMHKMGRTGGAIGFAVYLDSLALLARDEKKYDVDTIILYEAIDEESNESYETKTATDPSAMLKAIKMLTDNGTSVMAVKEIPDKIKYRQLLKFKDRGFEILENND